MNNLDEEGFTPFLTYIKTYIQNMNSNYFKDALIKIIRFNAARHHKNYA